LEKQFEGLKLEVNHFNRFLERKTMENQLTKLGIFTGDYVHHRILLEELAGHSIEEGGQDQEMRAPLPSTQGTSHVPHGSARGAMGMAVCLSWISLCLLATTPKSGNHVVRSTFRCMRWSHRCGSRWPLCTSRGRLHVGFSRWKGICAMRIVRCSVGCFWTVLVDITMRH
jgi:hypothetical protein